MAFFDRDQVTRLMPPVKQLVARNDKDLGDRGQVLQNDRVKHESRNHQLGQVTKMFSRRFYPETSESTSAKLLTRKSSRQQLVPTRGITSQNKSGKP